MNLKSFSKVKWPLLFFAFLLAGTLLLAACGDDEESSSSEASSSSSESASASGDSSGSGSAPSSSAPPAPAVALKTDTHYSCLDGERYPDDRAPWVSFTDTTFTLYFNTGEMAMGTLTGGYTLSGNALTLTVENRDITDYRGEDLAELPFTVQDEYRLVYNGDYIGMTRQGDTFEVEGAPPPAPAQPESSSAPASSSASGASSSAG